MQSTDREAEPLPATGRRLASQRRWVLYPIAIFLLTRLVDAVLLLIVGRGQDTSEPVSAGLPARGLPNHDYFSLIQNWDGQWFRSIAEDGYPTTLPREDGNVAQSEWGFLPLFPALARLVMVLTRLPFGPAVTLLNLTAAAIAVCLLYRLVSQRGDHFTASMAVLALCVFPSAVLFQLAYSEALALLFLMATLWFLSRHQYLAVLAAGVLLSLTRPLAIPVALVVAVHLLVRWRRESIEEFPARQRWLILVVAVAIGLFAGAWPFVASVVTGQPDAYLQTMASWGRVAEVDPWLVEALRRPEIAAIMAAGLGLQTLFLLGSRGRAWPADLRVWSFAYVVFMLLATRPMSSMFRHMLLAVVPLWPLTELNERTVSRRGRWLIAVTVAIVGFAAQYVWLRTAYIVTPSSNWFP